MSEKGNAEAGLVGEDIAQKYMRAHADRQERITDLMRMANTLTEAVAEATEAGRHDEALRLEVAATRAEVRAIAVEFQVGERDPEDES
jgi:hypothetical protein